MKIKPMNGRVLIKRCEPEQKTGGIMLPDTAQEKPVWGEVMAIGKFEKDKEFDIQVGDLVIVPKWGGTEVKDDEGAEYMLVKAEDIMGKKEK